MALRRAISPRRSTRRPEARACVPLAPRLVGPLIRSFLLWCARSRGRTGKGLGPSSDQTHAEDRTHRWNPLALKGKAPTGVSSRGGCFATSVVGVRPLSRASAGFGGPVLLPTGG